MDHNSLGQDIDKVCKKMKLYESCLADIEREVSLLKIQLQEAKKEDASSQSNCNLQKYGTLYLHKICKNMAHCTGTQSAKIWHTLPAHNLQKYGTLYWQTICKNMAHCTGRQSAKIWHTLLCCTVICKNMAHCTVLYCNLQKYGTLY